MVRKALSFVGCAFLCAAALLVFSPDARLRAQAVAGHLLTNGQVLIGSTGAAPVAATLTGTSGEVTVTSGAGSITLSFPTAVAHVGTVKVSSASTAGESITLAGAYDSLPTSGLSKNALAVLTSDGKLYIATNTPTHVDDWLAVGSQ